MMTIKKQDTSIPVKIHREDRAEKYMIRQDGWKNVLANLGTSRDKSVAGKFRGKGELTHNRELLGELYRGEGLARVVVERPTVEMTRRGFKLGFDTDGAIVKDLKRKGILRELQNLLRWSRLYGGAVGFIGMNDGASDPSKPVNVRNLKSVDFLHVYDRWRVAWNLQDLYSDPSHPKYGLPEFYRFYPILGAGFIVHESRTIRIDGADLSPIDRVRNYGWGDSVLQATYDSIRDAASGFANARVILHEFCIGVLKLKNLAGYLAAKNDKAISKRISDFQLTKSATNDVVIDALGEEYSRQYATVTGIPDIIDRFVQQVSMHTMIPVEILLGKSPSGLNATGDFVMQNWYDHIATNQEDKLEPPIRRLVELELLSNECPYKGEAVDDFEIEFVPLWKPSQKEELEARKIQSDIDHQQITDGMITEDEARESRLGGDSYSFDTKLIALPSELEAARGKAAGLEEEAKAGDLEAKIPDPIGMQE